MLLNWLNSQEDAYKFEYELHEFIPDKVRQSMFNKHILKAFVSLGVTF